MIIAINVDLARFYIKRNLIDKGEMLNDKTYFLLQKFDPSLVYWGKYFRNVALIQFHRGDISKSKDTYCNAIKVTEIGLFPENALKREFEEEYKLLFPEITNNSPEA